MLPPTVTFQIVVLQAEAGGDQHPEGLSPRAEKALGDVRDFLPYKSYRVLDSAWIHTDGRAETRLSGVQGQDLYLDLRLGSAGRGDEREIHVDRFRLLAFTGPNSTKELLTSSFGIRRGETIVVGTSKLDGPDKALVVLLSALP
jgi:hypothetical protein